MEIELKVDFNGKPYLDLYTDGDEIVDDMLKLFIRKAKENGLRLAPGIDKNADCDYSLLIETNDYKEEKNGKTTT